MYLVLAHGLLKTRRGQRGLITKCAGKSLVLDLNETAENPVITLPPAKSFHSIPIVLVINMGTIDLVRQERGMTSRTSRSLVLLAPSTVIGVVQGPHN
jgi:hypothetical protein